MNYYKIWIYLSRDFSIIENTASIRCSKLVGGIASFSKNMGTTIYGMTAQYWKSVVVGFDRTVI